MKKVQSTKEVLERLGIPIFSLIDLVQQRKLTAWTQTGKRVCDENFEPEELVHKQAINEMRKWRGQPYDYEAIRKSQKGRHFMNFNLDSDEDESLKIIDKFMSFIFYEEDLEKFENEDQDTTGETVGESKPTARKYPQEVIGLLTEAKPEIEDLYKGMRANWQEPNQENGETYGGSLKDAAQEWFDKTDNEYQIIAKKHVISSNLYFPNTTQEVADLGHPRRDFQGKLCQIIISETFSNKYISDLNNPPQGMGVKPLYDLLKSL